MPDNSDTHLQVMAAAVLAMHETALEGPTKAYTCNLHTLDSIQDSHQVTCMTVEDWQQADPSLSLVIARLWYGTLEQ